MRNIILVIEYDGTNYNGWQAQEKYPSIQEEIEKAIFKATKEKVKLKAAGRTDARVHALGQVANFFTTSNIPGDKFRFVLNNELPDDIRVQSSQEVDHTFNARFSATHKRYRYRIFNGLVERPLIRNFSYHVTYQLDVEKMRQAANDFIGTFDYKSFRGRRSSIKTSIRTVYSVDIKQKGEMIDIIVEGNSFLRNMVRIMVGTLIEIGAGLRSVDSIPWIIKQENRNCAGHTAPAQGLFLEKVFYK